MNTNVFKLSELKSIFKINKTININKDLEFDFCRVTNINSVKIEECKEVLYFPITISEELVNEGWVTKATDLRLYINNIIKEHPNYTFVVEEDMLDTIENEDVKLVVVDNIMDSVDEFYKYIINNNEYKVIAVTGSAGKTTCVGVIEHVLKSKYNVLRIYSSRITPLVLKSFIINFLNETYDIITLEMSIYYKHHVKALADLLKPDISAIINIGDAHLGIGGLNTKDDICINKSKIFEYASKGYINYDSEYLKRLNIKDKKLYYNNEFICNTNISELEYINKDEYKIDNDNNLVIEGLKINIPILTNLSVINNILAYKIASQLGIEKEEIVKSLNSFVVVENRLQRINLFGKNIIFDGDSSFKERIHQLSLHLYKKAYLVLREYGSNYYVDDIVGVKEYFKNFDKVFIFDNVKYKNELDNNDNVVIVNNHNFIKELDGEIFYHYHDYNYKYDEIKEEYLKTEGE